MDHRTWSILVWIIRPGVSKDMDIIGRYLLVKGTSPASFFTNLVVNVRSIVKNKKFIYVIVGRHEWENVTRPIAYRLSLTAYS